MAKRKAAQQKDSASRRTKKSTRTAKKVRSSQRGPSSDLTGGLAKRNKLILGGILLLTLLTFLPLFQNEFTNWDDNVYVTENTMITSLSGENIQRMFTEKVSSNHHPLTMLVYAINYQISGLKPWSYTLFQILFHLLNTFLVFVVIRRLAGGKEEVALFVSLFFGIHPMHVESVAWLSEHKDVLYTFFLLLSVNEYLKYVEGGGWEKIKEGNWKWLALGLLYFWLSLNSKSAAVAMPVGLFAIDYWLRRPMKAGIFIEKVPFLALSVVYGIIALRTQADAINESYSFLQKINYASYGFSMYFAKLFVPINLASFIPYPPTGEPEPGYLQIMPLIALAIVGLTAFSMRKTRLFAFGVAFFAIMISLTLQVVAVGGQIMAERYTYVPYIGLFFILGYGLYQMGQHPQWKKYHQMAIYATAAIALLFAFMSFQRTKVWKDSRSLWSDVIDKHPNCGRAWLMRGVLLYDENDDVAALDHFNKAVKYRSTMAFCYYNRGLVLNRSKRYDEAIADFDVAIAKKNNYFEAYHHRGNAKYYQGKFDEALENYNQALSYNSNFAKSYTNRGLVYYQKQQYEKAASDLERSIQLEAPNSLTYNNLGASYAALGQNQKAIDTYTKAIQINPNDANAYGNRAIMYRQLGQEDKARQDEAEVRGLRR